MMTLLLPLLLAQASAAQASGRVPPDVKSPAQIAAAAPASEWVAIAAADMLVMELAPDRDGNKRKVVIQLMPPPFSQGWIGNIRKLAAAHWWDGLSVNRVQDNYVAQWGDANAEDKAKAKALPGGLMKVPETEYSITEAGLHRAQTEFYPTNREAIDHNAGRLLASRLDDRNASSDGRSRDPYADIHNSVAGWLVAGQLLGDTSRWWPVHCYGMVGVGRDLSPDTGSGAELYTVIGHAPRHLDRNIALVGRVIAGIEHLSSLPRGTGALGFYEKPEQRVPIVSMRLASDLPAADRPRFEYLSTESATFARYADARANRRDAFFIRPAGGADICNIPVPVRVVK